MSRCDDGYDNVGDDSTVDGEDDVDDGDDDADDGVDMDNVTNQGK